MSNRDNQNKRDAGQTQQKENRENIQQNQNKAQYFFWREGLTAG